MHNGAHTLDAIAEHASRLEAINKAELQWGDCVLVTTKNSVYWITVLGDHLYAVWGGWFDRKGFSPAITTINGCSWGGSAIKQDIVAAPGLFLEFGNQVTTTRIRQARVVRSRVQQTPN